MRRLLLIAATVTLLVGCQQGGPSAGATESATGSARPSATTASPSSSGRSVSRPTTSRRATSRHARSRATTSRPVASRLPTKKRWLSDVREALAGSRHWLDRRVAKGGRHLAIVTDIDNTALATHYAPGQPVRPTRRLLNRGVDKHVVTLVATARLQRTLPKARRAMRRAGYHVTELCGRRSKAETLVHGKVRCRRHFAHEGYRVIAMVGNRPTDFKGGGYDKAWRLPNYHLRLS